MSPTTDKTLVNAWRNRLLTYCLQIALIAAFVALIPSLALSFSASLWLVFWIDLAAYALIFALRIGKGIPYVPRAAGIILIAFVLALLLLIQVGPRGGGIVWLFASVAFSALLLGRTGAMVAIAASTVASVVLGWALARALLPWSISVVEWTVHMVNFLAVSSVLALATDFLVTRLEASFARQRTYHLALLRRHAESRDANELLRFHLELQAGLLGELHHRVKNNLQLLASLLNLESGGEVDAPAALEAFRSRVYCLAVAHELLHGNDVAATVDGADLLTAIRDQSVVADDRCGVHRWCSVEVRDVRIGFDAAGPIALVVDEILRIWRALHREAERPGDCALTFSASESEATLTFCGEADEDVAYAFARRVSEGGGYLIDALVDQLHGSVSTAPGCRGAGITIHLPSPAARAEVERSGGSARSIASFSRR